MANLGLAYAAVALALGIALPVRATQPAATPAVAVQPEIGSGRKFREIIGLQVKFYQGQPQKDLPSLKELGVRWVREEVHWDHVERTPGQYQFPAALKERLAFYRQNDIGVVFLLAYANPHAYPATSEKPYRSADPEAFGRYAVAVARVLREAGVRFVLEIWNEPHNSLRPLVGGVWNGHPPSPWVDHYVKIVKETVRQVKAYDPTIKLLTDDDMWVIHYWFLEAGLPREIDGFAFHPYNGSRTPEKAAVDKLTDWLKPFDVVDADGSFRSAVRRLREHGKAKLGNVPEMWITEWGYPTGTNTSKGEVSEDTLAGYVPRAFISAEAAGVQVMCWFSAQDTVDGPMGLTANDGRHRKSYFAFKTMSEQLGDYVLMRQVAGAKNLTTGVQAFLFRGPRDYKLVVWSADDTRRRLTLQGGLQQASAMDVVGQPVIPQTNSSSRSIEFGAAPVYLAGMRTVEGIEASLAALDQDVLR